MAFDYTNPGDVFDSRDIIERIDEIEAEYADNVDDDEAFDAQRHIGDEDEREEYLKLTAFRDEVSSGEWKYGMSFVADDYFEQYAREFADDIGAIDAEAGWPLMHIDWEAAADSLRQDYTSFEFEGVTYWTRP